MWSSSKRGQENGHWNAQGSERTGGWGGKQGHGEVDEGGEDLTSARNATTMDERAQAWWQKKLDPHVQASSATSTRAAVLGALPQDGGLRVCLRLPFSLALSCSVGL